MSDQQDHSGQPPPDKPAPAPPPAAPPEGHEPQVLPARARKRLRLVIGIVVAVVMIGAGAGAAALLTRGSDEDTPEATVVAMIDMVSELEGLEGLGDLLCSKVSEDQTTGLPYFFLITMPAISDFSYEITDTEVRGDTATVTVTATATRQGRTETVTEQVPLVREDDRWLLCN